MTKSVLGRGLGSLIPSKQSKNEDQTDQTTNIAAPDQFIEAAKIQANPHQPRHFFNAESLQELVESIKIHGIIQPLVVYPVKDGYQLIAGERRLRAAREIGLKKVPVIIRGANEQQKLELALVENVQRENLNPIDKAHGFQQLVNEFNLTQEEVGKKVGLSRAAVTNALRLLSLSAEMQSALQNGKISEGHAKVLLSVRSEEERQRIYNEILSGNLSVRRTEEKTQRVSVRQHQRRRTADPNLKAKEDLLQEALGTKVEIFKRGEQGSIKVHFYSVVELQSIINKISK